MFMTTLKNIKRTLPFILTLGLLSFASCDNEDKAGKDIPSADFSISPGREEVEGKVQFTNTSYGGSGNYTFAWEFGDRTTSTDENPTHAYEEKGIYIVSLEITDSNGKSNICQKTIEIISRPVQVGDLSLKWVSSTPLSKLVSTSGALSRDEKFIYINSNDHVLRCYDTTDGIQKWEFNMLDPTFGAAATGNSSMTPSVDTDGTIYVGTGSSGNGKLFAITPNGTKKWFTFNHANEGFWNNGAASKPSLGYGTATFDDRYVYCGNNGTIGSLIAVDRSTGKRTAYLADSNNKGPAGGVLIGPVVSKQGMMFMLGGWGMHGAERSKMGKGDNKAVLWNWKVFGQQTCNSSMAVDNDGKVYGIICVASKTTVFCVNSSGNILWQKQIENTTAQDQGGVVIGTDGTIYASLKEDGDLSGGIIALSPTDGTIKWHYELQESISGTPAIDASGHILFGTENGVFYILEPDGSDAISILDVAGAVANSEDSNASQWQPTKGKFWSSPVIGNDGTIYIAMTNTLNENQSRMVALTSQHVTGPAPSVWPMKGRDAQHTSTVK